MGLELSVAQFLGVQLLYSSSIMTLSFWTAYILNLRYRVLRMSDPVVTQEGTVRKAHSEEGTQ